MEPIKIPETNHTFTRPSNMTEDECFDLPVVAGRRDDGFPEIVSVWKLSSEELAEVNLNGGHYIPRYRQRRYCPYVVIGIQTEDAGHAGCKR